MSRKRTLTARLTAVCLSAAFLLPLGAHALMPHISQNISLVHGWNAVYVQVSPEQTPDALFADWPVDHVGVYDPASFLATRQFSANWVSQGLPNEAMAVWYRGVPEASSLKSVPAGSVLVTFNTNSTTFSAQLYGAPAAPRTTWHVTGTNTVYNFVGFSVSSATDIAAYLEGSPCENVKSRAYYRIRGDDPNAAPRACEVRTNDRTVNDGDVRLLPSDKISDWSGVLYVSPLDGVNFGQNANKSSLSIRNDGTASRKVRVGLAQPVNHGELFGSSVLSHSIMYRDADAVFTNAAWQAFETYDEAVYKTLAPGETWKLEIGLRRSVLQGDETRKGLPFGALLKVSDHDGASHAKAVVPIYGETSGETATDWQNGLWVADVELDTVRMVDLARSIVTNEVEGVQVVSTNVVETSLSEKSRTGGKFKLRLPIHRDREGRLRLLQRVVTAGSTDADGTYHYKLYAGTAKPPDTDTTLMRISAVCLPTETPVIEASEEDLFDEIGMHAARFEFTVAPNGATSLLRHPYHPQHDGLRWDFQTSAPDGDDVYNYASDVKPETFSVKNEIKLSIVWDEGAAEWNPSGSFDGTCEWILSGLRHDGDIVVSGPLSLKRVSSDAQLILK